MSKKLTSALVVVAALSLGGCASVNKQPITPAAAGEIRGQAVAQTKRPVPAGGFAAMTPGTAAFAMLGALVSLSAGNILITENKVPDPADAIAADIVKLLEGAHGVKPTEQPIAVEAIDAAEVSAAARGTARFVVDVYTAYWSLVYFPTDWTHYKVIDPAS